MGLSSTLIYTSVPLFIFMQASVPFRIESFFEQIVLVEFFFEMPWFAVCEYESLPDTKIMTRWGYE